MKPSRENNSESMTGRVAILLRIHCHDLLYITVNYHKIFRTVFKLWSRHEIASETIKPPPAPTLEKKKKKKKKKKKSESIKTRIVILVRDTSSWPMLHNCEVS